MRRLAPDPCGGYGMSVDFGDPLSSLISRLTGLAATLPVFALLVDTARRKANSDLVEFLNRVELGGNETKQDAESHRVPTGMYPQWHRLSKKAERYRSAWSVIPRTFVVTLVSEYDGYLAALLRNAFSAKPQLLNMSDRRITLRELFECNSIEDARDRVMQEEIDTILRLSHVQQIEWFEDKLKIDVKKSVTCWPTFVEMCERRNLFVHTKGVISSQYLSVCAKHGVKLPDTATLGQELHVDSRYFMDAYRCLTETAILLTHVLWRKLIPDDLEKSDDAINNICYEFIHDREYEIPVRVLECALKEFKTFHSTESRMLLVVNLAQAYKWKGDSRKLSEIISQTDWSGLSHKFRLAKAVLEDDHRSAAEAMIAIGDHGEVQEIHYRDWPLFRSLIETPEFLRAYEEVFGSAFEVSEPKNHVKRKQSKARKATQPKATSQRNVPAMRKRAR